MSKKQNIIQAATHLFVEQSFEGTTTLQLANEAVVTEPLIYYHFKGKDESFNHILETSFEEYSSRLETLERDPGTQFERILAIRELDEALREKRIKKDSKGDFRKGHWGAEKGDLRVISQYYVSTMIIKLNGITD